jgi:hypothetical protein
VGLGVSVAGFASAAGFYAASRAARSDRDGACRGVPLQCDPSALDADTRYRTYTLATDVALGVGAAALISTGLVWWFTRPRSTARPSTTATLLPSLLAHGAAGVVFSVAQ